ncbi:hypothetical protein PTI98_006863 [Pleurotus ostreatus]|nr:hypothetical protein PTI98_006863 [Pleurotus ostreatus]
MRSSSSLNSNPFITSPLSASTSSSPSSHKHTNAHSTPSSTSSSDSYDGVFATVFPTLVQSVARKLTNTPTASGTARKRGGLTRSSSSPSTVSSLCVQQSDHSGARTSQKRTLKRVASMHSMDVDMDENNSNASMEVDSDDQSLAGQRQGKGSEDTLSSVDLSQTFQPHITSTPHDNHSIDKLPTTPSVWSQTQSRSRSQSQPRTESSSHPSSQSTASAFNDSIVDSKFSQLANQPPSQPQASQGQTRLSQPFRPPLPPSHVNARRGAPRLGMRPTAAAPVRRGGFKVPLLPDKARKARLEEIQRVLDSDASSSSQESCPSPSIATSATVFNSKSKPNTDLNRAKSSIRSEQLEDMDEMEEGNSSFGDISFELEWNEEVENMLRKQGV